MHRSAPRLHASYMHGQGSMDPTRPWRVGMVKTRHDVVVAKAIVTGEKHAPVVWRPPGKSEGQAVTDHRHLHGPPVPPSTDAVRNLRNETDLAALLAAAHVQLGEQRQHARPIPAIKGGEISGDDFLRIGHGGIPCPRGLRCL